MLFTLISYICLKTAGWLVIIVSLKIDIMAKLKGIIKVVGTMGDVTFAQTAFGIIAKSKSSLNKEKFYAYESMEGSRKASREFGHASMMGTDVRRAFLPVAALAKDYTTHFRINSLMGKVLRTDMEHEKGSRVIGKGDLSLLKGFEWNKRYHLDSVLRANYIVNLNKATGTMRIVVPGFEVQGMLKKPKGATHYQILAGGYALHVGDEGVSEGKKTKQGNAAKQKAGLARHAKPVEDVETDDVRRVKYAKSEMLEIKKELSDELSFDVSVAVKAGDLMLIGLGVVFYQESGGVYSPLKENACFKLMKTGRCEKQRSAGKGQEVNVLPVKEPTEKQIAKVKQQSERQKEEMKQRRGVKELQSVKAGGSSASAGGIEGEWRIPTGDSESLNLRERLYMLIEHADDEEIAAICEEFEHNMIKAMGFRPERI